MNTDDTRGTQPMATNPYYLSQGFHSTAEDGRCAMEWVAYLAGEPHSDEPVCVSPVLRSFCISFNDRLGDADRQRLRPYLARTIGTVRDGLDPERIQMCREFLIREALPDWLELAGRKELADEFRATSGTLTQENLSRLIIRARNEARAARNSARDKLEGRFSAARARAYADAYVAYVAAAVAVAVAVAVTAVDIAAYAAAYAAYAATYAATYDAATYDAATYAAATYAATPAARQALYGAVKADLAEKLKPFSDRHMAAGFHLLDRMLPKVAVDLPLEVEERVTEVCA